MWLRSDNIAGVDPTILQAIADCNAGVAAAYGDDELSRRLDAAFSALFETDVRAFPVVSGTAANALGLASIASSHGLIACHEDAHPLRSEAGATTFHSGGAGFLPVAGEHGRMDAQALATALDGASGGTHGALEPSAVTVTQLTEAGTAYSVSQLRAIGDAARAHGLPLHLDGARFANAVAGVGASPADLSWRAGVDVMSFGGTKNGTMSADAVLFFDHSKSQLFAQRLKRSGHSLSKSRFQAAQLLAYIASGRWLANAAHANAMARDVAARIAAAPSGTILHPVEGNIVFGALADEQVGRLARAGFSLRPKGRLGNGRQAFRLVASFATDPQEVARFGDALGA